MQSTRDRLKANPEVPDELIDDLVGRAQQLQDEAEAARGVPIEEVERVAEELGIDPRYVREALGSLEQDAKAEAAAAAERERDAIAASAGRKRRVRMLGLGVAGLLALTAIGGVGIVGRSANAINAASQEVAAAQVSLDVVLQRQADLAPQLIAISGGQPDALAPQVEALRAAEGVSAQIEASQDLSTAMAREVAKLPEATTDAQTQQRLSLQHELTGIQNRLRVERGRYDQAVLSWEAAADGLGGSAALSLGMAEPLSLASRP